jgi:phage tail sheath protein FI
VGQVTCEIGVAPVKPAEFVIFRLAQFSGGSSIVSE